MSEQHASRGRLPKGVAALARPRGGRGYRATIRRGKRTPVHLGLYETPWLAAFACNTAAALLGRESRPVPIPRDEQPNAERVREITACVRRRLGLDSEIRPRARDEAAPETSALLTLFEVTVVGFWRGQAAEDHGAPPGAGLDASAGRVAEAAGLLFWSRSSGHPAPLEAMTHLLARRLDAEFGSPKLTRAVLDDDGDDPWRVARWLAYPGVVPDGRFRPLRDELVYLYAECFEAAPEWDDAASWAAILGLTPPFRAEDVRAAFRKRSRSAHPDRGGSDAEFVRLREAYEQALSYCASRSG